MAVAKSGAVKWVAGVGIAAATYGLLVTLHPFGPSRPTTPDEAAALMMKNPIAARVLPVFKQTFPKDYNQLMLTAIENIRANVPVDQAKAAGFATVQSLVAAHATDIAHAPDAELLALARARNAVLNAVDQSFCAKTVAGTLTVADTPPEAAGPALGDAGAANLRAARAGIDHPTRRASPIAPADAHALITRMRAHGLSDVQVAVFTGGALPTAAPADQCTIGRAILTSVIELPPPQGARVMAELASG